MCQDCLEDAECQCGDESAYEEDENGIQSDGFCDFGKNGVCKSCGHKDVTKVEKK